MDDDGVQHFGSHTSPLEAAHWDTPDWRAEMEAKYADAPMPAQIAFSESDSLQP
jgi:hypothetical protein